MDYDTAFNLLNLCGLIITAIGAWIAARAFVVPADLLAQTVAVPVQSRSARKGFQFIFVGTLLQACSILMPLLMPVAS